MMMIFTKVCVLYQDLTSSSPCLVSNWGLTLNFVPCIIKFMLKRAWKVNSCFTLFIITERRLFPTVERIFEKAFITFAVI